jgi:UDP-2,4-diacetamido-2,4,6-trideoxy-beta-L-altropyranose hydrolase
MQIVFRVDASERIGTGHFMRCLTLADALHRAGAITRFICRHLTSALAEMALSRGHELRMLPAEPAPAADASPYGAWLGTTQAADAEATISALADVPCWDWLVVDHYALDEEWEKKLYPSTDKLLVIDDLANRRHRCDVLLDQNLQTTVTDRYKDLVPETARKFIGPRFALLRPEFREARKARGRNTEKQRLNIFFGGTDPTGATVMALDVIGAMTNRCFAVDAIAGRDSAQLEEINRRCVALANTALHVQPPSMAALFSAATLALGAGGATSWERCCLGLPTVIISVAQNQQNGSAALARARAAVNLGPLERVSPTNLASMLLRLIAKPRLLASIGRRASALVDGRGTERVALYIMQSNITLAPADIADAEITWTWRNHPATRRFFHDPAPIAHGHHLEWWRLSLESPTRSLLIAWCGPQRIGVLRFDCQDREALVSIYLDPDLTGIGLGKIVLTEGSRWLRCHRPEIEQQRAEILPENLGSQRGFDMAGYRQVDSKTWVRSVGNA